MAFVEERDPNEREREERERRPFHSLGELPWDRRRGHRLVEEDPGDEHREAVAPGIHREAESKVSGGEREEEADAPVRAPAPQRERRDEEGIVR